MSSQVTGVINQIVKKIKDTESSIPDVFTTFAVCYGLWRIYKITKNMFLGPRLKDLDIVMFVNHNCPWCAKMIKLLESEKQLNNVEVVDITDPNGFAMAQAYGADKQEVPSFVSRKQRTGTAGYSDSVAKLVDRLERSESSNQLERLIHKLQES